MNLKETLFDNTQQEYDFYIFMTKQTRYEDLDCDKQKERFDSLYNLIEEAGLTDEYNTWIEEHPSRLSIM